MKLSAALEYYYKARKAHDAAFAAYGGYSWGYHGYDLIESLKKAEHSVEISIDEQIDLRLKQHKLI